MIALLLFWALPISSIHAGKTTSLELNPKIFNREEIEKRALEEGNLDFLEKEGVNFKSNTFRDFLLAPFRTNYILSGSVLNRKGRQVSENLIERKLSKIRSIRLPYILIYFPHIFSSYQSSWDIDCSILKTIGEQNDQSKEENNLKTLFNKIIFKNLDRDSKVKRWSSIYNSLSIRNREIFLDLFHEIPIKYYFDEILAHQSDGSSPSVTLLNDDIFLDLIPKFVSPEHTSVLKYVLDFIESRRSNIFIRKYEKREQDIHEKIIHQLVQLNPKYKLSPSLRLFYWHLPTKNLLKFSDEFLLNELSTINQEDEIEVRNHKFLLTKYVYKHLKALFALLKDSELSDSAQKTILIILNQQTKVKSNNKDYFTLLKYMNKYSSTYPDLFPKKLIEQIKIFFKKKSGVKLLTNSYILRSIGTQTIKDLLKLSSSDKSIAVVSKKMLEDILKIVFSTKNNDYSDIWRGNALFEETIKIVTKNKNYEEVKILDVLSPSIVAKFIRNQSKFQSNPLSWKEVPPHLLFTKESDSKEWKIHPKIISLIIDKTISINDDFVQGLSEVSKDEFFNIENPNFITFFEILCNSKTRLPDDKAMLTILEKLGGRNVFSPEKDIIFFTTTKDEYVKVNPLSLMIADSTCSDMKKALKTLFSKDLEKHKKEAEELVVEAQKRIGFQKVENDILPLTTLSLTKFEPSTKNEPTPPRELNPIFRIDNAFMNLLFHNWQERIDKMNSKEGENIYDIDDRYNSKNSIQIMLHMAKEIVFGGSEWALAKKNIDINQCSEDDLNACESFIFTNVPIPLRYLYLSILQKITEASQASNNQNSSED